MYQAIALTENDPEMDCTADTVWAQMQDTPLEFTISREQYSDRLSGSVTENEELSQLLNENGIILSNFSKSDIFLNELCNKRNISINPFKLS